MSADFGGIVADGNGASGTCDEVVRIVEAHSGVSDVLGSASGVERLAQTVVARLEGGRAGTRFPLLRVLLRRGPVSAEECDALVREVVRLRAALAALPPDDAPDPRRAGDPALEAAAPLSPAPPLSPTPSPGASARRDATPRTLADAWARPLSVAEHVARLGGASRRGVRVEVGPDVEGGPLRARLGVI